MTDHERLRRQLNGGIISLVGLFAMSSYESFALTKDGGTGWQLVFLCLLVAAASPTFLGVVYLIRVKRKVLGRSSTANNLTIASEGNR